MDGTLSRQQPVDGWSWFEADEDRTAVADDTDRLSISISRCFKGADGDLVIGYLRQTFLDRRLGPKASDAELRFVEGQRSVVAHVLAMLERSRT